MVRILTQDCDPVMTRKTDLPPSVCAIVDACLKRERDERTSNSGLLSKQMDGAMREMKAVRFRSLGRRTTDRSVGETQRRASDLAIDEVGTIARGKVPSKALSLRSVVLIAAGAGVALGVVMLLLVMAVMGKR
jgi:serine/threonine-protein kinase